MTTDKANRITTEYNSERSGGDYGFSTLLNGTRLRKDSPACLIYGAVETLNNTISEVIATQTLIDTELIYTLEWLRSNTFSLSSFCFMKGDSADHVFPKTFLNYLNTRITYLKSIIGDAPDFLIYEKDQLRLLDKIRIQIREVEVYYITWYYDEKVITDLLDSLRKDSVVAAGRLSNMDLMAATLNRLSNFMWWSTRYEHSLLQNQPDYSKIERYWSSKVQTFPASVFP